MLPPARVDRRCPLLDGPGTPKNGDRGRETERDGREGWAVLGIGDGKDDDDGDGEPSPVSQLRRPPVVVTKKREIRSGKADSNWVCLCVG